MATTTRKRPAAKTNVQATDSPKPATPAESPQTEAQQVQATPPQTVVDVAPAVEAVPGAEAEPTTEPTAVAAPTAKSADSAKPPRRAKPAKGPVPAKPVPAPADKMPAGDKRRGKSAKAEKLEKPMKPAKAEKADKPSKVKLVRDSFTMPEGDYANLAILKQRCLANGMAAKKSELLRLGLQVLVDLSDNDLLARMEALEKLKTGRPVKN